MANKRMNLHILYNDELILKFPVRSLELVSEVKKRIGVRTHLNPGEISLEYNGKSLNDKLKLDHCGVTEDSPKLILTIINRFCDEVVMEQTSYQSPYEPVGDSKNLLVQQSPQEASLGGESSYQSPYEPLGDSKNLLVQQSPQGASLGGQDKGADSSTHYHEKSHHKVEDIPIDLRTYFPTPGSSNDDVKETDIFGDKVPERLTNSISLGLRLHSAHMLSLALAEYQDANQTLLLNYGNHEVLRRVSMAEDRLKEELYRMSTSLQNEIVHNQEISIMKKH